MANYWAIAIGINQYQFLQPLMYAQWDAYCILQCLQNNAHFSQERCWLLTDTSVPVRGQNSQPTRQNIQHHIVQLCQHELGEDDVLWLFFSGYGVYDNGRDYLVPMDGDPTHPIETGIPMSELFATLKTAATSNIVVLLDMKQFGGTVGSDARLGHHTLSMANEHRVAVMLACQPGQFSHETLALRQGLFTAVLLEGLQQHGCVTLEHLAQYVGDRLPLLSEQHWRPRQNPAIVLPSELRYQLFIPGKEIPAGQVPVATPVPESPIPAGPPPAPVREPHSDDRPAHSPPSAPSDALPPAKPVPTPSPIPTTTHPAPTSQNSLDSGRQPNDDETFWKSLLKWGGIIVALLLAGVVWRNWSVFQGDDQPDGLIEPMEDISANDAPSQPPGETEAEANQGASRSANLLTENATANVTPPGSGSPLEEAQQAISAGLPLKALEWLDQVPASEQTESYANLLAEAEQLNVQLTQTNRAILNEALASLNRDREETPVNQASDFHGALTQASRIQAGQPVYDEAQQYVERWSQVILDLAKARAQTGDYNDAVTAAQLIPPAQAEIHAIAEQHIAEWEQNVTQSSATQEVMQEARALVRPGQASSYNDAIAQLRTIETSQPEYESVRNQLNEWSKEILAIAYQRAESGNLYEAIEAGALVPDDAEVALEAREAVEGWRRQLRGN
ncbi:MAG: caspase family protein [Leptolyngbyaceae bacterium]|nr:caspase family protein [Leptolyngbyaceae bacterium]